MYHTYNNLKMFKIVLDGQIHFIEKEILKKYSSTIRNAINDTENNDTGKNDIYEFENSDVPFTNEEIHKLCTYLMFVDTFILFPKMYNGKKPRSHVAEFFDINIKIKKKIMGIVDSIDETQLLLGFELWRMIKSFPNKTELHTSLSFHIGFVCLVPTVNNVLYGLRQIKHIAYICDNDEYIKKCISFINPNRGYEINRNILASKIGDILAPIIIPSGDSVRIRENNYYMCKQLGMGYRWIDISMNMLEFEIIKQIKSIFYFLGEAGYIIDQRLPQLHSHEYKFIIDSIKLASYLNYCPGGTSLKKTLCFKDGILYDMSIKDFRNAYPWDFITNTLNVNYVDCINKGNNMFKPFITQILGEDNYDRFIRDISGIFKEGSESIIINKKISHCGETTLRHILLDFFDNFSAYIQPSVFCNDSKKYFSSKRIIVTDFVDNYDYESNREYKKNIHDIFCSDLTKIAFVCDRSIYQFRVIKRYLHSYYELSTDFTSNAQAANPAYYHSPTMKEIITHEFGYSIIEYLKNN